MIQVPSGQINDLAMRDINALPEALADTTFANHGFYAPMPRDVRVLLAHAAVAEAKSHEIDTLEDVAAFVQAMVDVTPRFPELDPFTEILANAALTSTQKVDRLFADPTIPHWDAAVKHLEENEDWHLDFWDERVDWANAKVRN